MENITFIISVMLYILFCTGVYFLSQNMDKSELLDGFCRLLQPFLLFILYIYLQKNIAIVSPAGLLACATGVITAFIFPVLFHVTHRGEPVEYIWPGDFRFGFFVVVLLLALADVFSVWDHTIRAVLLTGTEILFLLPGIFQLSYYVYYGECINEPAVQVLLNTNKLEAREYLRLISLKLLFVLAAAFLLLVYVMFRVNLPATTGGVRTEFPTVSLVISVAVIFLLFGCGSHTVFRKTGLIKMFIQIKEHTENLKEWRLSASDYPAHVAVESPIIGNTSDFGTVLLVIGESANRLHMKAFSGYERETTPWLSEESKTGNFYLFPNSYSSWIQTVEAVTMALTNKNQYTRVQREDEISVINIANKLGFNTHWFSAQGYSDKYSSEITVIANAAKNQRWLLREYTARQYDEKLLAYLNSVDADRNNFVVVHLEGSHPDFHLRYPAQFEKWPYDKEDPYGSNPYDNSVLYTDYILSQLFAYAKENLHLKAMVYFSDHGSLIGQKRKSSFSGFEDVRIPFFVYLSDAYKTRFPDTAAALRKHVLSHFTNDLIFDLLCGLLQVNGPLHNEKNDISSMSYAFTRETLKTNLGKTSLKEDSERASATV